MIKPRAPDTAFSSTTSTLPTESSVRQTLLAYTDHGPMSDEYETVHTMTDYYDGPRGGIAEVNGRPHLYTSTWADIDADQQDVFELRAVDAETLSLALESWSIWLRWEEAFHDGLTDLKTHPALPADRARRNELDAALDLRLAALAARPPDATAHADFRVAQNRPRRRKGWQPLQVRWSMVGPSST
jgi:hypothetical protein